jgi:hypothetical protein
MEGAVMKPPAIHTDGEACLFKIPASNPNAGDYNGRLKMYQ